jgi:hypothetical protein
MPETRQRDVTVELCLRSSAPSVARGRQETVRERVEALNEDDAVADATVSYWSTRVCVPDNGSGPADRCPRVVGEILEVARERGVSVEPYFRSRAASHDDDERVLFLPVICLLVRCDGDLCGLYPVTKGDQRYTVKDGIERLEAGEDPTNI